MDPCGVEAAIHSHTHGRIISFRWTLVGSKQV